MAEDRIAQLEAKFERVAGALEEMTRKQTELAAELTRVSLAHEQKVGAIYEKVGQLLAHTAELCSFHRTESEKAIVDKLSDVPSNEEANRSPLESQLPAEPPAAAGEKAMNKLVYFVHMWETSAEFRERYAAAKTESTAKKPPKNEEERLRAEGRESQKKLKNLPDLLAKYDAEHAQYKAAFN